MFSVNKCCTFVGVPLIGAAVSIWLLRSPLIPSRLDLIINRGSMASAGGDDNRLRLMHSTTDLVYGAFKPDWSPKGFEENKSRYLWTDAYGVVNYLTLYSETRQAHFLDQAKLLVRVVHDTLGKTRDGSKRLGDSTDDRPLLGGLRIGKPQGEGGGMSQDGQYYHYLTKWMFALNRMSKVTKDPKFNAWGVDLVSAVHPHFVKTVPGQGLRMFWKLSIDLHKPLVNSEGGLDPYDGYVMYRLLQETEGNKEVLKNEIEEMRTMVEARYQRYRTDDCLDAGEALWLSHFYPDEPWAKRLKEKAAEAVNRLWDEGEFKASARRRLAFREFGTTIGVQMHPELLMEKGNWKTKVQELHEFWAKDLYSRDSDITPVMFSTSLTPGWIKKEYP